MKRFLINWLIGIVICAGIFALFSGIGFFLHWLSHMFHWFPLAMLAIIFLVGSLYIAEMVKAIEEDLNEKDDQ